MAGLSFLPKPQGHYEVFKEEQINISRPTAKAIPPYGQRKGFIPRKPEHFGNGGAFPEIHVAQYPLDMGRKDKRSSTTLAVNVNHHGQEQYALAVAQSGHSNIEKDRIYADHSSIVEKSFKADALTRPGEEEVNKATQETREALEKIINGKIKAAQPSRVKEQASRDPTYVRYTPQQQGGGHNSGAQQRIVRVVEMQSDPMEPPKFTHKKIPGGPPSPPAPVMHSPPRKLTIKDQQDWKIPPCISNWKNSRGYTIPLDKRLAADGRGLQETTINDKFAKFSEFLYLAEQASREEVEKRAQLQKKVSLRQREKREEDLRQLAARARAERAGIHITHDDSVPPEAQKEIEERDSIRKERRRELERDMRLENRDKKRTKTARDQERDVGEKIALGVAPKPSQESQYDQRLFNQDQGLTSGFGDEEDYNVFTKPLFNQDRSSIYRPRAGDDEIYGNADEQLEKIRSSERFRADKPFQGTEGAAQRSGPVQFEKTKTEEDPFGLDQFISEAKKGKRRKQDDSP